MDTLSMLAMSLITVGQGHFKVKLAHRKREMKYQKLDFFD